MSGEFERIARYFAPLAGDFGLGLLDDAALLTPPPGRTLVLTADAIVAGIHFLPDDPPDLVARKLLRVNLSDLAAMGATPLCYLLTVAVPQQTSDAWFEAFAAGLAADQAAFNLQLAGGDTTSTPGPITLSATLIGHVAPGAALRRTGAQPGDDLWVTGTIGDAALGLAAAEGRAPDPDGRLRARYRLPEPRLGLRLPGIAHAAMDVSDGLAQDAGHLARAAGLRVTIDADTVPRTRPDPAELALCLTGGDDYELLLAVPPAREAALRAACGSLPVTKIGRFDPGSPGVHVLDAEGREFALPRLGWTHF